MRAVRDDDFLLAIQILYEEEQEEYLDNIAEQGYLRRQAMVAQIRAEISSLDNEAKNVFWRGFYS